MTRPKPDIRAFPARSSIEAYSAAIALIALSTFAGLWMAPRWGTAPVDLVYLPSVLAVAAVWGMGPGIVAAIAAALSYNFFFTTPLHTLRMDKAADIVTVVVLLVVALTTSRLAAAIRNQAKFAANLAQRNSTIAGFAATLLSSVDRQAIGSTACRQLHQLFQINSVLLSGLPEPREIAAFPAGNSLTPSDIAAAIYTLRSGEAAGRGTRQLTPAEWVFYPVTVAGEVVATVGLARDDGTPAITQDQLPLLHSLLDQLALALERDRLQQQATTFEATRSRDRTRAVLLSSIADDLRPMIDALSGTSRQLARSADQDRPLARTLAGQVARLDRYVGNIMDLGDGQAAEPVLAGELTIDLHQRQVLRREEKVHLTPKEYDVLAELVKQRGRVLSHSYLLRSVWGPAHEQHVDYLRVAIRSLRQKLEAEPARPTMILNEPGVGYRLAEE